MENNPKKEKKTRKIPVYKNLQSAIDALKKKRVLACVFFVVTIVIGSIISVTGFVMMSFGVLFLDSDLYIILLGPSMAVAMGSAAGGALIPVCLAINYRRDVYEALVPFLAQGKYDAYFYTHEANEKEVAGAMVRLLKGRVSSEGASLVKGTIGKISFSSANYERFRMGKRAQGYTEGTAIRFVFPMRFKASLIIQSKETIRFFKDKKKFPYALESESILFNRQFEAYSTAPMEGRLVLLPSILDGFISLERELHLIPNAFFEGNAIYIYLDTDKKTFRVQLFRRWSQAYLDELRTQILLPYRLLTSLGLR